MRIIWKDEWSIYNMALQWCLLYWFKVLSSDKIPEYLVLSQWCLFLSLQNVVTSSFSWRDLRSAKLLYVYLLLSCPTPSKNPQQWRCKTVNVSMRFIRLNSLRVNGVIHPMKIWYLRQKVNSKEVVRGGISVTVSHASHYLPSFKLFVKWLFIREITILLLLHKFCCGTHTVTYFFL